ncbi:MAG: penicillin-binding protein activator [Pseudomonadaceae bacterium]|nr:penicillin-binding protein activator [Pseudomonadaceae bacterium]
MSLACSSAMRFVKTRRLAVLVIALTALSACESTNQPRLPTQSPIPIVDTAPSDPASLMDRASRSRDAAQAQLYLDAALAFEQLGALADASAALALIDDRWLPITAEIDYDLLRARELYRAGNPREATALLDSVQARVRGITSNRQRLAFEQTYIEYDKAYGDYISAANRLMRLPASNAGTPDNATGSGYSRHAALWQLISQASQPQANLAAREAAERRDRSAQGWWLLAETLTGAFGTRDARSRYLRWRQDFPNHPAAALPPPALKALIDTPASGQSIAVLLPLSGRLASAGNAVRDGIAAAYLDNRIALAGGSQASVELRFYDTAEDDISNLLDSALAAGSSAIIGPLARENVEAIIALNPPIPVLALNYVELNTIERKAPVQTNSFDSSELPGQARPPVQAPQAPREPSPILQLALAIEDEASEIARQLRRDGHERVAVLHTTSSWAERATATLADAWGNSPFELMEARSLRSVQELTEQVGDVMLVDASEARHSQLSRALGLEVEFQPRARDDLDAVVALLDGRQAKALRPALRFHFAGELPVYAASRARRGLRQSDLADLNGMQIVQSGWDLGQTPLSQELNSALGDLPASLVALQALGVDALRIASQLEWFAAYPRTLEGSSGHLVTRGVQVRRQPGWAVVSSGSLTPMPTIVAGQ